MKSEAIFNHPAISTREHLGVLVYWCSLSGSHIPRVSKSLLNGAPRKEVFLKWLEV